MLLMEDTFHNARIKSTIIMEVSEVVLSCYNYANIVKAYLFSQHLSFSAPSIPLRQFTHSRGLELLQFAFIQ